MEVTFGYPFVTSSMVIKITIPARYMVSSNKERISDLWSLVPYARNLEVALHSDSKEQAENVTTLSVKEERAHDKPLPLSLESQAMSAGCHCLPKEGVKAAPVCGHQCLQEPVPGRRGLSSVWASLRNSRLALS